MRKYTYEVELFKEQDSVEKIEVARRRSPGPLFMSAFLSLALLSSLLITVSQLALQEPLDPEIFPSAVFLTVFLSLMATVILHGASRKTMTYFRQSSYMLPLLELLTHEEPVKRDEEGNKWFSAVKSKAAYSALHPLFEECWAAWVKRDREQQAGTAVAEERRWQELKTAALSQASAGSGA